jgi:hypothetical protein
MFILCMYLISFDAQMCMCFTTKLYLHEVLFYKAKRGTYHSLLMWNPISTWCFAVITSTPYDFGSNYT